jgi:hypothetical protein
MVYITISYYKTDYLGTDPGDDTVLTRLIARASDMVDLLTARKAQQYDDLYAWQQTAIQKSTAAITEYYVENGDTFNEDNVSSESTGGWSVSLAGGSSKKLPDMGIAFLEQADLMRANIDVTGEGYCETH